MKYFSSFRVFSALILLSLFLPSEIAAQSGESVLPDLIAVPPVHEGHVQGIAVDVKGGAVYLSFTTMLMKCDLSGKVIGTVTGLTGHLGCLDFSEGDGYVYGSLEYKDDVIGKGILKMKGSSARNSNDFYVARIDGSRITAMDMDAAGSDIMKVVSLPEVLSDYSDTVKCGSKRFPHRYACSGIDGICVGPGIGGVSGGPFVTVAYGVYGDTTRSDNDYQVIRQYSLSSLTPYFRKLTPVFPHLQGPEKADNTCFVYTGNTDWGVQNLEYDSWSGLWFMAVYRGKKNIFPNYNMYAFSASAEAKMQRLCGVDYDRRRRKVIPLAKGELTDPATGISGWNEPSSGCFGMHSLGGGLFYFAESYRAADGREGARIRLYRYDRASRHFSRL